MINSPIIVKRIGGFMIINYDAPILNTGEKVILEMLKKVVRICIFIRPKKKGYVYLKMCFGFLDYSI